MSAGSTNQEGLVLHNASVLTMDPTRPRGRVVEARGSRILGVGTEIDRSRGKEGKVTFLDCQGKTVVPGFVDAHTHFLAYASSLLSVDCTPSEVGSIEDVKAAIAARARETPEGSWIRGAGYDEFYLAEKRHPSAKDLDQATQQHPVKLIHRSGHACVLNSYALRLARISIETPEPLRGVIERQQETGEPTGLFLDLDQWLDERLKGSASQENIEKAVSKASERYLSMGITSLQDASPSNSLERWRLFDRLKREGWLVPRVSMMIGYCHIDEVVEAGLGFGSGDDDLRLGSAKVFLSQVGGSLSPSAVELIEVVQSASRLGFPVAVHAVEKVEVEAAIKALESAARSANPNLRHRIEHCSIAPPDLQERLARLN
ncbi:MAG: amidohydrolase, partial [Dehalococcoidia bacterium]